MLTAPADKELNIKHQILWAIISMNCTSGLVALVWPVKREGSFRNYDQAHWIDMIIYMHYIYCVNDS